MDDVGATGDNRRDRTGGDRCRPFQAPGLFHGITAAAFPDDTAKAIQVNGAAETLIGTAIAIPKTRKAGFVALGLYGAYLAANAVKARG